MLVPALSTAGLALLGALVCFPASAQSFSDYETVGRLEDARGEPSVLSLMGHYFEPSVIYTHTAHDLHQDHRAAHRATLVAGRGVANVYCYQSPSTTIEFTGLRPGEKLHEILISDGEEEHRRVHPRIAHTRPSLNETPCPDPLNVEVPAPPSVGAEPDLRKRAV